MNNIYVFSLSFFMFVFSLIGCKSAGHLPDTLSEGWTAGLSASSTKDNSPSKLYVSWNPVGDSEVVSHYVITAAEVGQGAPTITTSAESGMDATIAGLKPATTYSISLKACKNDTCSEFLSDDATATGATP